MSWQHTGGSTRIDSVATLGLDGVADSLAYRAGAIARHHHSYEHWFGLAVTPDGEVHVADSVSDGTAVAPFRVDAGNDVWGAWVQILGSSDTPVIAGCLYYDLHRISVVGVENANNTHFVQVAFGASGAAAISAATYTELVFRPQTVQGSETILTFQMRRIAVGTKAWMRNLVRGQNTSWMDIYHGSHEYEG